MGNTVFLRHTKNCKDYLGKVHSLKMARKIQIINLTLMEPIYIYIFFFFFQSWKLWFLCSPDLLCCTAYVDDQVLIALSHQGVTSHLPGDLSRVWELLHQPGTQQSHAFFIQREFFSHSQSTLKCRKMKP